MIAFRLYPSLPTTSKDYFQCITPLASRPHIHH
ncbi:hypothetical protein ATK23_1806 [Glutamicibacter mysorens]|uniref:Uncharacterized protein n=1 Tax=Glutamicibacter mysorens TaxID=257984 RepID=A0ABX4MZ87_9MICC|nr:hypothetical protein ATK23_1806 [Glutamicibacter mysorens]